MISHTIPKIWKNQPFRVISLLLGQSYDFPSACEVTHKKVKFNQYLTTNSLYEAVTQYVEHNSHNVVLSTKSITLITLPIINIIISSMLSTPLQHRCWHAGLDRNYLIISCKTQPYLSTTIMGLDLHDYSATEIFVQYIPYKMYMVLLCFVLLWLYHQI